MLQAESSIEQAIRNKWMRDVLENERELEFYKTQYLAQCILVSLTQKTDTILDYHKRILNLCFPWSKEVTDKQDTVEDAVRKFKAMHEAGTIEGVKNAVSVNEVFDKWTDPLLQDSGA